MRIRPLALSIFVVAVALPTVSVAATDPSALVTELGLHLRQVLADGTLTPIERQQQFRGVLDEDFDFPMISRFVLGRYWQASSDAFRQEFSRVFEDYVIQSLSPRFADYSGASMNVTATRAEGEHSTIVSTTIVHADGTPPAKVDWRVQDTPGGLKIADVSVSGMSMALAYREQFAAVINRDGGQVAALIPDLRQKLDGEGANSTVGNAQANEGRP